MFTSCRSSIQVQRSQQNIKVKNTSIYEKFSQFLHRNSNHTKDSQNLHSTTHFVSHAPSLNTCDGHPKRWAVRACNCTTARLRARSIPHSSAACPQITARRTNSPAHLSAPRTISRAFRWCTHIHPRAPGTVPRRCVRLRPHASVCRVLMVRGASTRAPDIVFRRDPSRCLDHMHRHLSAPSLGTRPGTRTVSL